MSLTNDKARVYVCKLPQSPYNMLLPYILKIPCHFDILYRDMAGWQVIRVVNKASIYLINDRMFLPCHVRVSE